MYRFPQSARCEGLRQPCPCSSKSTYSPDIGFLLFFLKILFILFLERGERREKERDRNISVWLSLMRPLLGTWPTTQACALTGNQTSDPLVCKLALNPLNHTSQSQILVFNLILQ